MSAYSYRFSRLLRRPVEAKQFTSWAFSQHVRDAGIAPSMGAVGSAYDNALMEASWARVQVELFNQRKWKTRVELATAIHDYTELWHNTRRRHSALGMRTPVEVEEAWAEHGARLQLPPLASGELHQPQPTTALALNP